MIHSCIRLTLCIFLLAMCNCIKQFNIQHEIITGKSDTVKNIAMNDRMDTASDLSSSSKTQVISSAESVLIAACDNYIVANKTNPKASRVMLIKASLFFNKRLYEQARLVCDTLFKRYPFAPEKNEAMQIYAESYFNQNNYDSAQAWYRAIKKGFSFHDTSKVDFNISESIFRKAQQYQSEGNDTMASRMYLQIAHEFPKLNISHRALLNAIVVLEHAQEWRSVLQICTQIIQQYSSTQLVEKAMLQMAKTYEKMELWDSAALSYISLIVKFPSGNFVSVSLFNAAVNYERDSNFADAASLFFRYYSKNSMTPDAFDALLRSGELYAKIQQWDKVIMISQTMSNNFSSSKEAILFALYLKGIADFKQGKLLEAVDRLKKVISQYYKLVKPSTSMTLCVTKSHFALGEIYQSFQNNVIICQSNKNYVQKINEKNECRDKAVKEYSDVLKFSFLELSIQALFRIGLTYDEYGSSLIDDKLTQCLTVEVKRGMLQAADQIFTSNALPYYEKVILLSKQKKLLTFEVAQALRNSCRMLFSCAKYYETHIMEIENLQSTQTSEGADAIGEYLMQLQLLAPLKRRVGELFFLVNQKVATDEQMLANYKCNEQTILKFYSASASDYSELITMAKTAPIPKRLSTSDRYKYKVKVLSKIQSYEQQALKMYTEGLKLCSLSQESNNQCASLKSDLAKLLFESGRCFDVLSIIGSNYQFNKVSDISEMKKKAVETYRLVLKDYALGLTDGEYVTHSYVRLYQLYPEEFGIRRLNTNEKNSEIFVPVSPVTGKELEITKVTNKNYTFPDIHNFNLEDGNDVAH